MRTQEPIVVNGKAYPLWSQFVHRKSEWIGKRLQDFGDSMDSVLGIIEGGPHTTTITDIALTKNGDESAMFSVEGKDFTCAFDVQYGGTGSGEDGWITFYGYGGHKWRIENS